MKKRFWYLILLIALMLPFGVQAQTSIRFVTLQVDLWPEYDRPEMLVIMKAQLPSEVSLPTEVAFRIPAGVGEPNAVAVRQPDGALLNAMYTRQVQDQWEMITVTATSPEIQIEYYDPGLDRSTANRHYEFNWVSDYDIDAMLIQVQQPLGATNLSVEPALGNITTGSDGLQYYVMEIGAPRAGDEVSVVVDYTKTTDTLSVEGFTVQPGAPISDSSPESQRQIASTEVLPWALGGLGVLLVVGGIYWYWRTGQGDVSKKSGSRRRRKPRPAAATSSDESGVYCHQCGKRAGAGDRFCRACGSRLRKD